MIPPFCLLITLQHPDSSLRDLALSWSIYSSPTHDIFDSLMLWVFRRSCGICWRCSKISKLSRMRHKTQTLRKQKLIGICSPCNLQYVHRTSDTNARSICVQEMLSLIKQKPLFSFEEYKSMLNFRCGVDQALGEKGASQATDKDYNMYLIELHALAIGDLME